MQVRPIHTAGSSGSGISRLVRLWAEAAGNRSRPLRVWPTVPRWLQEGRRSSFRRTITIQRNQARRPETFAGCCVRIRSARQPMSAIQVERRGTISLSTNRQIRRPGSFMKRGVRPHLAELAIAGVAFVAPASRAMAWPLKFDLLCHYSRASGHESYIGTQLPYTGPRVEHIHVAVDLKTMTERFLNHDLVPGPIHVERVDKAEIRLRNPPSMKEIIRRSDGRYTRIDVETDNSRLIYKGRCRFGPFTQPGPPGQAYRGW